jgi:hypothetical protein
MLLVIIALLWVALLAPMAVRRLRDTRTERSIASFHSEHEALSRQTHSVEPAYRLSEPVPAPVPVDARAPRLTVVHAEDTYRSLESRRSWDEWSEDYDYDRHEEPAPLSANRYASAYASVPRDADAFERYESPVRRRNMRAQRRMIFTRLVLAVLVATTLALVVGYSPLVDLAIVSWVALASYGALALYAVSQGLLDESVIGLDRLRTRQPVAVETLYGWDADEDEAGEADGARISALYDADEDEYASGGWRRESSQFALG